jgi:ABC-type Fe3+/spermidine/putrescine transport system ATPase subunit
LGVEQLSVRYGNTKVLQDVDLGVAAGELVALLGSSGCGKTTLLRAVAGFAAVATGRIVLAGEDVTRRPPEARGTAMVFQSYALWPHMSVAGNIGYGLRLRRVPRAEIDRRIAALLTLLRLEGLAERRVTQLSGGQRQRVALGRALAVDPRMLLLDEPLSNLDAAIRLELRHEIRAIQQRLGMTALHVTHDREEAMVMADRIVVLNAGRIAQQGTPTELYHRPASAFVARFMGADNVVRLAARPGPAGRLARAEDGPECLLPDAPAAATLDAHFRATAARLLPAGETAPADCLVLRGHIGQVSYPGGVWRHRVEIGAQHFLIDDAERHAPGEAALVAIPAAALHLFPAAA